MKKLLLILFISMFATSCTLSGGTGNTSGNSNNRTTKVEDTSPNGQTEVSVQAGNFDSLYGAFMTAQANEVRNALKIARIFDSKKSKGDIQLSAEAGSLGKVNASANVLAHAKGFTSKVLFSNVKFNLETMMAGKIDFTAKEFGMIQSLAANYIMFGGVELPAPYADQIASFKDYEGKWIELPNPNAEGIEALKQLASLTEKEVDEFLTQYPILKAKGEAKIDGTKNTFEVELNADNILALRKALSKRMKVEDTLTSEDETKFKKEIEEVGKFAVITLTFDTKNHLYIDGKAEIKNEEKETMVNATFKSDKESFFAEIVPTKEKGKITLDIKRNEAGNTTVDVLTDMNEEKTNTHVEVGVKEQLLTLFKMTFESSDVQMNADYTYANNAFNGKMKISANKESIDFALNGTTKGNAVESLKLTATGPEGIKMMIDAKDPKDNMMKGTFAFEMADQGKVTGNIGLALGKEIFGLTLDTLKVEAKDENPQLAQIQEILDTVKLSLIARGTNEFTTEVIEMPKDSVKFEDIMGKMMPSKSPIIDTDLAELQEGNVKVDEDSISVQNNGKNIKIDTETVSVSQ